MSVNKVVNARPTATSKSKKSALLVDPERVRKEKEAELRKIRILQVRDDCKDIARKLRQDIAIEKEKQSNNVEAIKSQELNCWRNHVLAHNHYAYCSAVDQIGAAHLAAKEENEQRAARDKQRAETQQQFRKKLKARIIAKNQENKINTNAKADSNKTLVCTSTQTVLCKKNKMKRKKKKHKTINKRANNSKLNKSKQRNISDSDEVTSDDDDSHNFQLEIDSSTECTSCTSSCSDTDTDTETEKESKCTQTEKSANICKTPTVLLDVEAESSESVEISIPCEIQDKHIETNRQFSRLIRPNPVQQTANIVVDIENSSSKSIEINIPTVTKLCKPYFTQISDLLQKTKPSADTQNDAAPTNFTLPVTTTQSSSPRKSPCKSAPKSPHKCGASATAPTTTAATNFCNNKNENVKYYDYNNKYTKDYPHPKCSVRVQPRCASEQNAMEQAKIEKQSETARQHEIKMLNQLANERGQKALESEKVRRDCQQLTDMLDALARQGHSLLPSDANLISSEHFKQMQQHKENKMNAVVEEMLLRPAIITCPEVRNQSNFTTVHTAKRQCLEGNVINLAADAAQNLTNETANSSDSCSILLGYVDDQSKHIRTELNQCETQLNPNNAKIEKLKNLLKRIEQLRETLKQEIKHGNKNATPNEQVQQVIETLEDLAKTHNKPTAEQKKKRQQQSKNNLDAQLQQKLCEFIDSCIKSNAKRNKNVATNNKHDEDIVQTTQTSSSQPVEIVIKVKGDTNGVQTTNKAKIVKSPRRVATLIRQSTTTKNTAKKKQSESNRSNAHNDEQQHYNSYDSSSTAYRSLPNTLKTNAEQLLNQNDTTSTGTVDHTETTRVQQQSTQTINPVIAHYIQRLLGMSRNSITALGVSSSDIETPNSSIMNVSTNKSSTDNYSDARLERIQKFIEDNRSFINELEQSICSQKSATLETSLRILEDIWKKNLCNNNNTKQKMQVKKDVKVIADKVHKAAEKNKPMNYAKLKQKRLEYEVKSTKTVKPNVSQQTKQTTVQSATKTQQQMRQKQTATKAAIAQPNVANNNEDQIAKYEALTENCVHRIAELTELINKVRQEKQRLLESTFSSVSETEYLDLPADKKPSAHATNEEASSNEEEHTQNRSVSSTTDEALTASNQPLEKHKPTGHSRDSGISMSRPVTAQEIHNDIETPVVSQSLQRKAKLPPPPTLMRFSPQLAQDDVPHELSTIVEVDTPATSRISVQPQPTATTAAVIANKNEHSTEPLPMTFPTFEQYLKEYNLDITQIDPEYSMRIQQEFNDLIANLQANWQDNGPTYEQFPTLTAYLQNLTSVDTSSNQNLSETTADVIDELFESLRVANLTIKSFPTTKEYMQKLGNVSEANLIDTESLLNLSDSRSTTKTETIAAAAKNKKIDTDTDSINIEEELKRRNILKKSFRFAGAADKKILHSTATETTKTRERFFFAESGIDKFSNSDILSDELEEELLKVGINWPAAMRRIEKNRAALSSSSTPSSDLNANNTLKTSTHKNKNTSNTDFEKELLKAGINWAEAVRRIEKNRATLSSSSTSDSKNNASKNENVQKKDKQCNENEQRPLNLREFLTKELLKHADLSSSSSNADDSLKTNFFLSVVGTMTPKGITRADVAGSSSIRQKTSTPVQTQSTPHSQSSSTTTATNQLFSGESHLSSVRYSDNNSLQNRSKSSEKK